MQDPIFDNLYFFDRKVHKQALKMSHMHYHEDHELYCLLQGRTRYFIGSDIFLLEPGDFIFIPSRCFHKTESIGREPVIRLLLSFSDALAGREAAVQIQRLGQSKLIRLPQEYQPQVQSVLMNIEKEHTARQEHYEHMMLLYFRQLLILLDRHRLPCLPAVQGERFALIQSVAKYISDHPESDLRLCALSQQFHLSPSYLSRLFRSVTGAGISEHINISRITAAETLLLGTRLSISEIAKRCGFNDSNYFASVFRRYKGITPKKYRAYSRK